MNRAWIPTLALVAAGCAQIAQGQRTKVDNLRVQLALNDYEAAQRKADPLDLCVKAKLVAIAYTDARSVGNAEAWRAREREDCSAAMNALGATPPPGASLGPRPARPARQEGF